MNGGGEGALNHLPLLFCKSVYTHFLQETVKVEPQLTKSKFFDIIFLFFSIAFRTIAYCISIVLGKKVEYKLLIEEFFIKEMCIQHKYLCWSSFHLISIVPLVS